MDAPVYLAKEGKVSGPFEPNQISELKSSGEFYTYEWMWDGKSPDWAPVPRKLTAAPGLPAEKTKTLTKVPASTTAAAPAQAQAARPFQGVDLKTSTKTFCAVLFDSRITLGGEITQAHARGGHFVSTPSQGVPISKGTNALIDVLDESSDRSAKIQANVSSVSRMGDRWVLELEWAGLPLLDS